MNSDRCVAYADDPGGGIALVKDSAGKTCKTFKGNQFPTPTLALSATTGTKQWRVFDVIEKQWRPAPGNHCPFFSVQLSNDTDRFCDYIADSISADNKILALLKSKIQDESTFKEDTYRELAGSEDVKSINRKDFLSWRLAFCKQEIQQLHEKLAVQISVDEDVCKLIHEDDEDEEPLNPLHMINRVITDFIRSCYKREQQRHLAKLRFEVKMSRPAIARCFYRWKLSIKKGVTSDTSMSMFEEPALPIWGVPHTFGLVSIPLVRHPYSTFTSSWEGVQAFFLIYIAFSVLWRLTFNDPAVPGSFLYWVEMLIDIYFAIDCFFNFHTCFYDSNGDMQGVKRTAGGGADYQAMYLNYLKGWAAIDIVSIFPFDFVFTLFDSKDQAGSADQLKALKTLRLLRLAKLLKLARALQLFKKYEEQLGPLVNAIILIGTLLFVIHAITCGWFWTGTHDDRVDTQLSEFRQSHGWVDFIFGGTDNLCGCYNNATSETFYAVYNPTEKVCVDVRSGGYFPVCDESAIPSPLDYYYKALFTGLQGGNIDHENYNHSVPEMYTAAILTMIIGFMWGAVAGAWSTIFAANAMAGQAFSMKISQVKEFCRVKSVPIGVRRKLVAHYEHLYPEGVIVDERQIIAELPPRMREELVRYLYGRVLSSVPLFFGMSRGILTELCLGLIEQPVLRGDVIAREGQIATEMFCIESGACRITSRQRIGEDEERARVWIQEVFAANTAQLKRSSDMDASPLTALCKSLQDGIVLCELVNYVLSTSTKQELKIVSELNLLLPYPTSRLVLSSILRATDRLMMVLQERPSTLERITEESISLAAETAKEAKLMAQFAKEQALIAAEAAKEAAEEKMELAREAAEAAAEAGMEKARQKAAALQVSLESGSELIVAPVVVFAHPLVVGLPNRRMQPKREWKRLEKKPSLYR